MIILRIDTAEAEKKLLRIGRSLNKQGLLKAIGERQLRWINQNFRQEGKLAGGWTPLRANTIAGRRKGSSAILQDTGELRKFTKEVGEGAVWVGNRLFYAKFHEYGTRPYTIYPRNKKALSFVTVEGRATVRYVHHPGLPVRRMLPLPAEARDMGIAVLAGFIKKMERAGGLDGES